MTPISTTPSTSSAIETHQRGALWIVVGAIDRVDHPHQRCWRTAVLFTDDGVTETSRDATADQVLNRVISPRREVHRILLFQRAKVSPGVARLARQVERQIVSGIDGGAHADDAGNSASPPVTRNLGAQSRIAHRDRSRK
jgi:hypothetical protein